MLSPKFYSLIGLFYFWVLGKTAQTCYYPDGKSIAENDTPCNSSASTSACCGNRDFCLDNGLCLLNSSIIRGSCTDSGWGSACPQYCLSTQDAGAPLSLCGLDSGGSSLSCDLESCAETFSLSTGNAIMLRAGQVTSLGLPEALVVYADTPLDGNRSSSIIVPGSAAPTCGPTTPTTADNQSGGACFPAYGHNDRHYTAKEMAAVGAGIGLPLALMLLGLGFLLYREKRSKEGREQDFSTAAQDSPTLSPWQIHRPIPSDFAHSAKLGEDAASNPPKEDTGKSEMSTDRERQELEARPAQKVSSQDSPGFIIQA